ncbi:FlgD immunoglobulin-like domain containing protein, partial [Candidatus Poribacteria bacterium]
GSVTTQGDEASVHVRAVDAAGNIGSIVSASICVDTVPPVVIKAEYPKLARAGTKKVSIHFQDDYSGMSNNPADIADINVQIQVQNNETPTQFSMTDYVVDPELHTSLWTGSGVVLPGMNDINAVLVISGARDKAGNVMVTNRDNRLEIDTQSPPPPLSFSARPGSGGSVTLTWESSATDVASYRLYAGNDILDIVSGEATEWEGILSDGEYEFGILAVDNARNEGGKSLSPPIEIDGTSPMDVTNLTIEFLPGPAAKLSWDPPISDDVTKYEIEPNTNPTDEPYVTTNTVWISEPSEDIGLHSFTVKAVDELGNRSTGEGIGNTSPSATIEELGDFPCSSVVIEYQFDDAEKGILEIACQYRKSGDNTWYPASISGIMENITDYAGEITWNSREDIPSTGGIDVEFRITPRDRWLEGESDFAKFRLVNLLGDYNCDGKVHDTDIDDFQDAWEKKDISRELGSKHTEGEPPDLTYAPDGIMDFEDLRVFSQMWMWFAEKNVAAPILWSANDRTTIKPVIEVSEDSIVKMSLPTSSLMGSICLEYDPSMVNISSVSDTRNSNVVLLYDTTHPGRTILAFSDLNPSSEKPDSTEVILVLDWQSGIKNTSIAFHYDIRDFRNRTVASGTETREMRQSPEESELLQNYPNPFNPETWIPYHLSESSSVVISIHSASGQLVRTIDLGFKDAGYYSTQERAAYWDGKNETGEPVASGTYFYSIRSGEFTDTRKMIIAR